ncbi:hypothetical protein ACFHW2_11835 [Actinomadura sp. LOL_016]|uniref:hypothetical protein n=1 Tax=unclassified Actinomadura TaxID=2626254 RepID=UPI003A80E9BF
MELQVTAWPRINGVKRQPGDIVEVPDAGLAKILIRDGQARPVGTPEPVAGGPDAAQRAARLDAGLPATDTEPADPGAPEPAPKPGRGATHAEWVAYAVANGMERSTAEAMKRSELTAHYAGS